MKMLIKTMNNYWIPKNQCIFFIKNNRDRGTQEQINYVLTHENSVETIESSFCAEIAVNGKEYVLAIFRLAVINEGASLDEAEKVLNKRYFMNKINSEASRFLCSAEQFAKSVRSQPPCGCERTLKTFNLPETEKKMALCEWNFSDEAMNKFTAKNIETLTDLFREFQLAEKAVLIFKESEEEALTKLWGLSESGDRDIRKALFLKKTIIEGLKEITQKGVDSKVAERYLRLFEIPKADYLSSCHFSWTLESELEKTIIDRDKFYTLLGEVIV